MPLQKTHIYSMWHMGYLQQITGTLLSVIRLIREYLLILVLKHFNYATPGTIRTFLSFFQI